jgi:hypothetical protein
MMKVDLVVGAHGAKGSLLVNGVDISHHVRAVEIRASVNEATSVVIELVKVDVTVDAESVSVEGVDIPLRADEVDGCDDVTGMGDKCRFFRLSRVAS